MIIILPLCDRNNLGESTYLDFIYSSHLNLIERLGKFVPNECLYSKYYETFSDFKQAINHGLNKANTQKKEQLVTLLTWNFQSFWKVKFLPVHSIIMWVKQSSAYPST